MISSRRRFGPLPRYRQQWHCPTEGIRSICSRDEEPFADIQELYIMSNNSCMVGPLVLGQITFLLAPGRLRGEVRRDQLQFDGRRKDHGTINRYLELSTIYRGTVSGGDPVYLSCTSQISYRYTGRMQAHSSFPACGAAGVGSLRSIIRSHLAGELLGHTLCQILG
jgi:hypothetical protein